MKYYKIIKDNIYIDIASSENFREYNEVSQLFLLSNEKEGQFIRVENKLYRDAWMMPLPSKQFNYIEAEIIEISEEEYLQLEAIKIANDNSLQSYQPIPESNDIEEESTVDMIAESTIDFARNTKINEMSNICRQTIEEGFDLEIRDEIRHFSLDTQDQLNLISLSIMAQTQSLIPYHADGEECIFYTNEEINEIVETANAFRIYHTTYYNALKNYINALESIADISAIEYGIDIPEEYQTDVLKALQV